MMSGEKKTYSVGILTVSDSRSCGDKDDVSGAQIASLVSDPEICPYNITVLLDKVPDSKGAIKDVLKHWSDALMVDLILTVGGTGFSPRDVTPEATEEVCNRKAPSLACSMISLCYEYSPFAILSRATCGIRGKTVILNLPGSVKGSKECFLKVSQILFHAVDQVKADLEAVELSHRHNTHTVKREPVAMHLHHSEGTCTPPPQHEKSRVIPGKAAFRDRTSPYPMVSSDEALEIILSHTTTLGTEWKTSINDFVGRISAYDVKAVIPSPPFRASIKDGYAILTSDKMNPRKLMGVMVAGDAPDSVVLKPGGCVRVSTGAPIPLDTDTVVQVEDTAVLKETEEGDEAEISFLKMPQPSVDIREIGSDIKEGQTVLQQGKLITPFDCGLLAAAGVDTVSVHMFPRVALLSTGDELVKSRKEIKTGTIIDSSKPVLMTMLQEMNVEYSDIGIAKDNPDDIKRCLQLAFSQHDVIVVTGGVSMGEKDFIKDVLLTDFLAEIHFGRIHMKPGKPTAFATVMHNGKKKIVFCLPGNPVSTVVTFHLYVVPCLRKIMGHQIVRQLVIKAALCEDVVLDPRPEFQRATITWDGNGRATACSTGSQLSSRLLSLSDANALMVLPPRNQDMSELCKGTEVKVLLLNYFASQS